VKEVVVRFKQAGGNFDVTDAEENFPLHVDGSSRIAARLLAAGADPAAQNTRGETRLHQARTTSRLDLVMKSLQAGAAIDHRTNLGWTPLVFSYQADVSGTLIQHCADVNAVADQVWTALHSAATGASIERVPLLLLKGANINAPAIQEQYLYTPGTPSTCNVVGDRTLLHAAVIANIDPRSSAPVRAVGALLDYGADMEAQDSLGRTPLLLAIDTNGFQTPRKDVVNYLIERGADMEAVKGSRKNAVQLADARGFRITKRKQFERKPPPPFVYGPR
jgi:ankyrin repeat protein